MDRSFNTVIEFENLLAKYFGSSYCVAVDCCTHAVELCFRQQKVTKTTCPNNTYLSIPMMLDRLDCHWQFEETKWKDYYRFGNSNIYDAATFWKKGGYIKNTMMCLSFQFKKTLSLGRGGAILLDNHHDAVELKRMSYDYRRMDIGWQEQLDEITQAGFHYYMTPETAQLGIKKLSKVKQTVFWTWKDYPDLQQVPLFR